MGQVYQQGHGLGGEPVLGIVEEKGRPPWPPASWPVPGRWRTGRAGGRRRGRRNERVERLPLGQLVDGCHWAGLLVVAAELLAHGRQHPVAEVARPLAGEAREQGGRQHTGRHPFVDRRPGRPSALPRVRDPARERGQLGVAQQGVGGQVEQPRAHHAAPPPQLRPPHWCRCRTGSTWRPAGGRSRRPSPAGACRCRPGAGCRAPRRRPPSGRTRCRCGPSSRSGPRPAARSAGSPARRCSARPPGLACGWRCPFRARWCGRSGRGGRPARPRRRS